MWQHWVVRAAHPHEPFRKTDSARWFWFQLAELFPERLSAVLMPNHLHMILPSSRSRATYRVLGGLIGAMSRRENKRNLWQKIPEPSQIPDLFHLRRQLRYIALNPCRKGLCADPLEWHWSSYREIFGATTEQSLSAEKLAKTLGEPTRNFKVRFHAYVSGDPSVRVEGTPLPKAQIPQEFAERSIIEILSASAAALRLSKEDVAKKGPLRTLFIHMAHRHGWRQTQILSKICEATPRTIQQTLKRGAPLGIESADLCLGDSRLRMESANLSPNAKDPW